MAKELIGEERLANAVIAQACSDYLDAKTTIRDNGDDDKLVRECSSTIESIKKFFYSDWFSVLTDISPDWLIKELDKAFSEGRSFIEYIVQ